MSTVIAIFILVNGAIAKDLKLLEVVALSRHNIRSPFTTTLEHYTPKKWPTFDVPPGHLTRKGAKIERFMGRYFYEWMKEEGLLKRCPKKEVYVYANCIERTIETAKSFVKGAFPGCHVPVHYRNDTKWDPIFDAAIRNGTKKYLKNIRKEMKNKINMKYHKLKHTYRMINEIIDLKNSHICTHDYYCDLTKDKDKILVRVGVAPDVRGPIDIGNSIVDMFVMGYYEGKPMEDVGWGLITRPEEWEVLTKITKENQDIRFNLTSAMKDLIKPLLKYMADVFLGDLDRKFTLLVAHDASINSLTAALGFKPFELPNQYEPFPVGGKLVFQKWTDGYNVFLKVEYIYQTWEKLREGAVVNMKNPPQVYTMEMNDCPVVKDGFCLWNDFVDLLKNTLRRFETE